MPDNTARHSPLPRRGERGQVAVLFALLLPVVVGFLSLSIAASIELNTRAELDGAALNASIAASGDGCMSSPDIFDLFECTGPTTSYAGIETPAGSGLLPQPPFTKFGPNWYPNLTLCGAVGQCVVKEQQQAQNSADDVISKILQAEYPSYTITPCGTLTHPAVCPTTTSVLNNNTVYYRDYVSYWYYVDTADLPCPITTTPPCQPSAANDNTAFPQDLSSATGGTIASNGDSDTAASPSSLVCPESATLVPPAPPLAGREIAITVWIRFNNPFAGVLGIGNVGLSSTNVAFGCGGS